MLINFHAISKISATSICTHYDVKVLGNMIAYLNLCVLTINDITKLLPLSLESNEDKMMPRCQIQFQIPPFIRQPSTFLRLCLLGICTQQPSHKRIRDVIGILVSLTNIISTSLEVIQDQLRSAKWHQIWQCCESWHPNFHRNWLFLDCWVIKFWGEAGCDCINNPAMRMSGLS